MAVSSGKKSLDKRKLRVRSSIKRKSNGRARLVVFRSNQHVYAQIVDAEGSRTLAQSSTLDEAISAGMKSKCNVAAAKKVGSSLAIKAKSANIVEVVFDRGPYRYHGVVKALADAAREGGLDF